MNVTEAFICDAVRTPIGRYAGALARARTDDLAAVPIKSLMKRHPKMDWSALDELVYGCANQAGEDNRNVARMMLRGGRAVEGNRSRSGKHKNAGSSIVKADKPKSSKGKKSRG